VKKDERAPVSTMARSCIRCGGAVQGLNCSACTWPYAVGGWCLTTRHVRRITLDIGGVNAKRLNPYLNQLEDWQASGFVDLQRSKVFLGEFRGPAHHIGKAESIAPHPPVWRFGLPLATAPYVMAAAVPNRDMLKGLLFPTTKVLSASQEHDIQHLQQHVHTGGDLFVTTNPRDFIYGGKQEALLSRGMWVFTPEQAVGHLRRWVVR
jgi:hypothetical protein